MTLPTVPTQIDSLSRPFGHGGHRRTISWQRASERRSNGASIVETTRLKNYKEQETILPWQFSIFQNLFLPRFLSENITRHMRFIPNKLKIPEIACFACGFSFE